MKYTLQILDHVELAYPLNRNRNPVWQEGGLKLSWVLEIIEYFIFCCIDHTLLPTLK